MSAPCRRTLVVRLAQLAFLAGWVWLLSRPVFTPRLVVYTDLLLLDRAPVLDQMPLVLTYGDPLPWLMTKSDDPALRQATRSIYLLHEPKFGPGDTSAVTDWFAPVPGLLLALAVPPLIADRRAGRWRWVMVGAAVGGLTFGGVRAVLTGAADRGMIGAVSTRLHEYEPMKPARLWFYEVHQFGWGRWTPPATLLGLAVGGTAVAGTVRPWRKPDEEGP